MMITPASMISFLVLIYCFLLLFVLPLILSDQEWKNQPSCTPFDCGSLGKVGFPFSNITHPECGLYAIIDCNRDTPKIDLKQGEEFYDVKSIIFRNETIVIKDQFLNRQSRRRNCKFLKYLSLPISPLISFKIRTPFLTLFKCNKPPRRDSNNNTVSFFTNRSVQVNTYKGCNDGYILYYSYPEQLKLSELPKSNHVHNCSALQLPLTQTPSFVRKDDLFPLLTAEYSLEWNVSRDCLECYNAGGQCLTGSTQKLQCAKREKDKVTEPHSNGKNKVRIGVGAAVGAVILALFIFLLIRFLRKISSSDDHLFTRFWKKEADNDDHQKVEAFFRNYGSIAPKKFKYTDVKKITNSFTEKLGQGGYGSVFKGKLHDGRLVAVKILFNKSVTSDGGEFINEVASISRTSHVNIVCLLGFCFERNKRALIYEFMPNGSLDKFIYGEKLLLESSLTLGWEALYRVAIGIARGLEYLHRGCNTRILHFDIKPHNILLDENFCPKISDFGLAKLCPGTESIVSMLGTRGTIGYIAPEVFSRNFGAVSHKSDVYSYGMMVLEMVGCRNNIEANVGMDQTSEQYFPHWIYDRLKLDEDLQLHEVMTEEREMATRKMVIVGLWCIQTNPSSRPSMSKVLEMLEGSIEALQIPPKPFLSSTSRSTSVTDSCSIISSS